MKLISSMISQKTMGGIALLEAAMCFTIFCSLLMMTAGLWNYVDVNNGITLVSERYSRESSVAAFQYDKNKGSYDFTLANVRNDFAETQASKAYLELKKELNDFNDESIRLEIAFTSVSVDPFSGKTKTANPIYPQEIISMGQSTIPTFLLDQDSNNGEIDFNHAVKMYLERAGDLLAIPTKSYGLAGSQNKFLSEVPLIAIRIVYNYQNAGLLKALGIMEEPYAWDIKVAALRGEVG